MTAYLIVYGKDPSDRFAAYQYPSRTAAREASLKLVPNSTDAEHGNGGGCAYVIERAEDVTLSGIVLVAVYNALTNANLKKFETRQIGVERLLKHLPEFAQKAAPIEENKNMDTETTAEAPKKYVMGEFHPVRRNSNIGSVLGVIQDNPGITVSNIAQRTHITKDKVVAMLKALRRSHGIDHSIDDDGMVNLVLREDKSLFRDNKEKPVRSGAPRQHTKTSEIMEKAKNGVMPVKPVVTSPTNMHRQKHFDTLAALASSDKWDEVRAYHMKGIDSYSAMINRYRDALLAYHETQMRELEPA